MSDEKTPFPQADETGETVETPEVIELSEEELADMCRERVCPGCTVMREAEDLRLRSLADADNVRKRLARESDELRKYAGENVLADLLPVIDNLDLALAHGASDEVCKDFVTGVEMTRKVFLDTLDRHGLVLLTAEPGEEFDPAVQEAVGMAQVPDLPDGAVAQMVQAGYQLKGRLLRPAKVLVNKIDKQA